MAYSEDPLSVRNAEQELDSVGVPSPIGLTWLHILNVATESGAAGLQGADGLLERLLEGSTDRHCLSDALHLAGQGGVGQRELLESEAGDFHHTVVDRRLEAGGRCLGDVVLKFVESVADGELGCDLGNRIACGLGGEGRGARDARIHLDDDLASILGVHCKLDVRASGLHPNGADDCEGIVPHLLILLVGKCLDRGNRYGVAGVDSHRVEVLNRADNDAVVSTVADDLYLVLLPAK